MKNLFLLLLLFSIISLSCSPEVADPPPNSEGDDIFIELSDEEKVLLGKWYFEYRVDELGDGTYNTHYNSYTSYSDLDQPITDSLTFYSIQYIGIPRNSGFSCPVEPPEEYSNKKFKLIRSVSFGWFSSCFRDGAAGWLIEKNSLFYYSGKPLYDMIKYPIEELNKDSLVFAYSRFNHPDHNIVKQTATFYKKQS